MAKLQVQGAILAVDDGTGTYIPITQVTSFEGFDGEATEVDVTCLESTAVENVLGLRDFGNFNFDLLRDDTEASHIRLFALQASGAASGFRLTLPNGTIYDWNALVQSFPISGGVNAALSGTVSTRVTGAVTVS